MTVVATLEDKGLMGFLLDLFKFFECEMCERQDVLDTQFVDASIEYVCFAASQRTAIDDSGIIISCSLDFLL